MRIVAKPILKKFWEKHTDAERPLSRWYSITKKAKWSNFSDVKKTFGTVDTYNSGNYTYTVFDIGGNKYRLIAKIEYDFQAVFIAKVMRHKDYSKETWKDEIKKLEGN